MGSKDITMKKIIFFSIIFITTIIIISVIRRPQTSSSRQTIQIGSQEISVEIAKSISEISKGLGQRDTLGSDGMLFVMPLRIIPSFWMKDMHFDLDFVWIDSNTVIDLTENVSAQRGDPDSMLRIYSPKSPATHVLEMKAGEVQKRGIKVGDAVQL